MDEDNHVPIMAYSPIEQAGILSDRSRARFARHCGMTPAQAALAWLLINENLPAPEHTLTREQSAWA
jgi:diketogulonate reductase-like aldo/keto reductase